MFIPDPSEAASLFVSPQLEEKKQKYEYFLIFLKEVGLWEKTSHSSRASALSNLERLQAAIDLNAHNNYLAAELPVPPELAESKTNGLLVSRLTTPLTSDDQVGT